ncbi:MAG: hypothetical protein VKN33_10010 [Candidatus Sericytochromatia bacterium]|nr:hypothetical protein [Candidatus Sericytochromatia bacterium]
MKLPISLLTASAVLLAGCGAPALTAGAARTSSVSSASNQRLPGRVDVNAFANQLRVSGWTIVSRFGMVISAKGPDGTKAIFDLSSTPRTGQVIFRANGVSLNIPYAPNPELTDDVAGILIALTARMVLGGAQAFVTYWLAHRGDAFNREECAAAVVSAMVLAATSLIPGAGPLLSTLLGPVVRKWVERWIIGSGNGTVMSVLIAGSSFVPEMATAVSKAAVETGNLEQLRKRVR